MEVIYLKSFEKDLKKIKDKKIKKDLKQLIFKIKNAKKIEELSQVKKIQGYSISYRIKLKNYRLGIYKVNSNSIELVRFIKREDIYKAFP